MKNLFFIILLIITHLANTKAQQRFESLDELFTLVNGRSISIKSNDIRYLQAKKAKIAAQIAILDPITNINGSFTDNTRLPVNLFPAEIFGGQKGEFRQVQTGVPYNTSSTQNVEIKLLNLEAWQNLKLSEINIQISENDIKLNQKNLYENVAASYHNILQLKAQLESTKQNLVVADTLFALTQRKFNEGIVKKQDVNDSKVTLFTIKENINQIEYLIKQNYTTLKILTDIPNAENIEIVEKISANFILRKPFVEFNNLLLENYRLKELSSFTTIQRAKRAFSPTISFVASNAFNQYNNDFTILGGNWITSNYVGVKINFALHNANLLSNKFKAEYDYQLAQKNTEQAQIKADLIVTQLETDWEKALSQTKSYLEIMEIQKDTYEKNKNLYNEGLISIDRVLGSFNSLINAKYSLIASNANVLLAQAKIDINNKIK